VFYYALTRCLLGLAVAQLFNSSDNEAVLVPVQIQST
jgi:hypothetical protein